MNGAANVHRLARFGHADDGAEAMPGRVVGWKGGRGEENDRDVLQARSGFYDGAEIFAANVLPFGFDQQRVRRLGGENGKCLAG